MIMELLGSGKTGQKPSQTLIHSFLKIESASMPGILLKAWEYIGEQNKFGSC